MEDLTSARFASLIFRALAKRSPPHTAKSNDNLIKPRDRLPVPHQKTGIAFRQETAVKLKRAML